MTYTLSINSISDLFQAISAFSDYSISEYMFKKYAQEKNNYDKILLTADQTRDPGLKSDLVLLAMLYKKAVEIGGGFNYLKQYINNIFNTYLDDEDDTSQQKVEDVLNELIIDLRNRAGGNKTDKPTDVAALRDLKNNFNEESLEEEMGNLSVFDQSGGVKKDDAGKGFGRGFSVGDERRNKDWENTYKNEIERYSDLLDETLNIRTKQKIQELITVLNELIPLVQEEKQLVAEYQSAGGNDEESLAKLNTLREKIKELKSKRNLLKSSVRNTEIDSSITALENSLNSVRDEREKERIKQEIELLRLSKSQDKNKSEELGWRKVLLKSMSGGNWPSTDMYKKIQDKIQEAAAKKKSISDYNKEIASYFTAVKSKKDTDLLGEVIFFGQNINTQLRELKVKVFPEIKKKTYERLKSLENSEIFKPYIDAIDAANKAGDIAKEKELRKDLNKTMSYEANKDLEVQNYIECQKDLQEFEADLNNFIKSENKDPEIKNVMIDSAIERAIDLKNSIAAVEGLALFSKSKSLFNPIKNNLNNIMKLLDAERNK